MTSIELTPADPAYPAALFALVTETEVVPPTLYVRGTLPALPGVAIVGTRVASDDALRFSRELARALGAAGYAIWSGGARGIDAAAHEGALDAGAPTVVVSGSGHARPYPREHAALFDRVLAAGGALVARVPDDTPPLPARFLQRNAVLVALTRATVVVEAGLESGARSAAAAARRLGRTLCAVPHAPWSPRGVGCALELVAGARAITGAADVIAALGDPAPPPRPRKRAARRGRGPADAALPLLGAGALPLLGAGALPLLGAGAPPGARAGAAPTGTRASAAPAGSQPAAALSAGAPPGGTAAESLTGPPEISAGEHAVLDALACGPLHIDEVCEKTGLPPRRASEALLTLTLQAVVVEGPAGLFRRALR